MSGRRFYIIRNRQPGGRRGYGQRRTTQPKGYEPETSDSAGRAEKVTFECPVFMQEDLRLTTHSV